MNRMNVIFLLSLFVSIQFLVSVSAPEVMLTSAAVRTALRSDLLSDFSRTTNFESKVTRGALTRDELSAIVDSSLQQYQHQYGDILLPQRELRKHILGSLVPGYPAVRR